MDGEKTLLGEKYNRGRYVRNLSQKGLQKALLINTWGLSARRK